MSLEPELREVCEDVYAYLQPDGSWYLNNTGFLVSRTGVISVDATSTERRTRAYLDAIGTVTGKPVRTWSTPITTATTRTATT
jgi:cyclase